MVEILFWNEVKITVNFLVKITARKEVRIWPEYWPLFNLEIVWV